MKKKKKSSISNTHNITIFTIYFDDVPLKGYVAS